MPDPSQLAISMIEQSHDRVLENLAEVSLDEALFVPVGGYRSVLGTLKHIAAWSHVYRSYAFDEEPQHWKDVDWPRGLRDTIVKREDYFAELKAWLVRAKRDWIEDLSELEPGQLDEPRLLHWGERRSTMGIVIAISSHNLYHTGELNQVLSICRGEAWEEGEEVEENNVSTEGHRVRPPWLDQDPPEAETQA